MDRLVEENFQSDFFVPASRVDAETTERIERVLRGRIVIDGESVSPPPAGKKNPFI